MNWNIVRGAKINSNINTPPKTNFKLIHKRIMSVVKYEMDQSLRNENWCTGTSDETAGPPGLSCVRPRYRQSVAKWIII